MLRDEFNIANCALNLQSPILLVVIFNKRLANDWA